MGHSSCLGQSLCVCDYLVKKVTIMNPLSYYRMHRPSLDCIPLSCDVEPRPLETWQRTSLATGEEEESRICRTGAACDAGGDCSGERTGQK